jgi:hypothetical protein
VILLDGAAGWGRSAIETNPVWASLIEAGVDTATLHRWLNDNPKVPSLGPLGPGKIFDITEGLDTAEVVAAVAAEFESTK